MYKYVLEWTQERTRWTKMKVINIAKNSGFFKKGRILVRL